MPLGEGLRGTIGREAATVVADDEAERAVVLRERDRDSVCIGMPDDVRQELARGRVDELLLGMAVGVPEVELELELCARRGALGERPQGRVEPGLVEDVRMEVEDRVTQLPDRLCERVVRALERGMGRPGLARLLELVPRRQQVLDRVVVQGLGERLALALLRVPRVREQPRSAPRRAARRARFVAPAVPRGGRRRRRSTRGIPPA